MFSGQRFAILTTFTLVLVYLLKGSEVKEGKEPPGLYQLVEAGAQLEESLQPRGRSNKSSKTAWPLFQIINVELTS